MKHVELVRLLVVTEHLNSWAVGPDPHMLTEQRHLLSKYKVWVMEDRKSHRGMWSLSYKDIRLFMLLG